MAAPIFHRMEKWGVDRLRRFEKRLPFQTDDQKVHILTDEDRLAIRQEERKAIWRLAIAGGLSALVAALAEVYLRIYFGILDDELSFRPEVLSFWGILIVVTMLATGIEILYIFHESLRATHRLAQIAGLDPFSDREPHLAVAASLARAALELPNPPDPRININPSREVSRWQLIFSAVIYKLKIMASNVLMKLLLRRLLGRVATRMWLAFIAVPITAIWNAVVGYFVLKEARIRTLGPSLVLEFSEQLMSGADTFSLPLRLCLLQAVGSSIVRSADLHPNLAFLFFHLAEKLDLKEKEEYDNSSLFLKNLRKLKPGEQSYVLKVLELSAIIGSPKIAGNQSFLKMAYKSTDLAFDEKKLKKMRKQFLEGERIDFDQQG